MITVHHLNNSRSQRVLWLLEELEVPYQIKRYQREASMLAPAKVKKGHCCKDIDELAFRV
ncbi:glutathione S-transferase-like domain protein, partial [Candidatus Erwinia dacicola]